MQEVRQMWMKANLNEPGTPDLVQKGKGGKQNVEKEISQTRYVVILL